MTPLLLGIICDTVYCNVFDDKYYDAEHNE